MACCLLIQHFGDQGTIAIRSPVGVQGAYVRRVNVLPRRPLGVVHLEAARDTILVHESPYASRALNIKSQRIFRNY